MIIYKYIYSSPSKPHTGKLHGKSNCKLLLGKSNGKLLLKANVPTKITPIRS